jgi:electron transfer flavoprotein alpha subunit
VIGEEKPGVVTECSRYGVDQIIVCTTGRSMFSPEITVALAIQLIQSENPDIVLLPDNSTTRELAADIAAETGGSVAADCIDISFQDNGRPICRKPIYGGKAAAGIVLIQKPAIVTIRANVIAPQESPRQPKILHYDKTFKPSFQKVDLCAIQPTENQTPGASRSQSNRRRRAGNRSGRKFSPD